MAVLLGGSRSRRSRSRKSSSAASHLCKFNKITDLPAHVAGLFSTSLMLNAFRLPWRQWTMFATAGPAKLPTLATLLGFESLRPSHKISPVFSTTCSTG